MAHNPGHASYPAGQPPIAPSFPYLALRPRMPGQESDWWPGRAIGPQLPPGHRRRDVVLSRLTWLGISAGFRAADKGDPMYIEDDENPAFMRAAFAEWPEGTVKFITKEEYDRLNDKRGLILASAYNTLLYKLANWLYLRGGCCHDLGARACELPSSVRDSAKRHATEVLGQSLGFEILHSVAEFTVGSDDPCPDPRECWVRAIVHGRKYPPPNVDDYTNEDLLEYARHLVPDAFEDIPSLVELAELENNLRAAAEASSIAEGEAALWAHESTAAFQLECDCPLPANPFGHHITLEHRLSSARSDDNDMAIDYPEDDTSQIDASTPTLAEAIRLETQLSLEAMEIEYAEDESALRDVPPDLWGISRIVSEPVSPLVLHPAWLDVTASNTPDEDDERDPASSCTVATAHTSFDHDEGRSAPPTQSGDGPTPYTMPWTSEEDGDGAMYWRERLFREREEKERALASVEALVNSAAPFKRALEAVEDASLKAGKRARV